MRRYLFHGAGDPPPELVDLYLCRDVYKCPPSMLDEQDWHRVQAHMTCLDVEAVVAEHKQKVAQSRGRRRR